MFITPVDENEKSSLEQFKCQIADLKQDEETLLRFLRAREHNIRKAEEMLRKSLKWKAEMNFGPVSSWNLLKVVEDELTFQWMGPDKDGNPVMWIPLGRWDVRTLIEKGHKDGVVDFVYFILETIAFELKKLKYSQATFIYGMEQLTMWKVANLDSMQILYNAFQNLEANYPEIIKTIFVINAPWAFTIAFNVIKPILSQHTINKFRIMNSDKSKWLPVLLENIPKESIPDEYL